MRLEDVDSDDDLGAALRLSDGELQRVGVYDALDAVASPGIGAETLRSRLDAAGEPELVSDDLAHLMAQHEGAISVRLPRELNTLDQGLAALPDSRSSDEPFGERWLQIGRDMGGGRPVMTHRLAVALRSLRVPWRVGCQAGVVVPYLRCAACFETPRMASISDQDMSRGQRHVLLGSCSWSPPSSQELGSRRHRVDHSDPLVVINDAHSERLDRVPQWSQDR